MKQKLTLLLCFLMLMVACDNDNNLNKNESQKEMDKNIYQVGETAVISSERYDLTYEVTVNDYEIIKQIDKYDINEKYNDLDEPYFNDAYVVTANVSIKNINHKIFIPVQYALMTLKINDEHYTHSPVMPTYLLVKDEKTNEGSTREHFPEASNFVQHGEEITGELTFYATIDATDIATESFWLKFETGQPGETIWEIPSTLN